MVTGELNSRCWKNFAHCELRIPAGRNISTDPISLFYIFYNYNILKCQHRALSVVCPAHFLAMLVALVTTLVITLVGLSFKLVKLE